MSFQEPLNNEQVLARLTEYVEELESHVEALKRQQATQGDEALAREQTLMLQIQLREKELQEQIERLQEQLIAATDRAAQTRESIVRMRARWREMKERLRARDAEIAQMHADRVSEQTFQEGVELGQTKALETVLNAYRNMVYGQSVLDGFCEGVANPTVESPRIEVAPQVIAKEVERQLQKHARAAVVGTWDHE